VNTRIAADKGLAELLRRQLGEAAAESDIRGYGYTVRWSERQGTRIVTVRFSEEIAS
jgi:hypothetical protein